MARQTPTLRVNRSAPRRWCGRRGFVGRWFALISIGWFAVVSIGVPQHLGLVAIQASQATVVDAASSLGIGKGNAAVISTGGPSSGGPSAVVRTAGMCHCDPAKKRAGLCCCRQLGSVFGSNQATSRPCCSAANSVPVLEQATCQQSGQPLGTRAATARTAPARPQSVGTPSKKAACCSKELTPRAGSATKSVSGVVKVSAGTLSAGKPWMPVPSRSEGARRLTVVIDGCGCGQSGDIPGLVQNQDPRVLGGLMVVMSTPPCIGWVEFPVEVSPKLFAVPPVPPPRLDVI